MHNNNNNGKNAEKKEFSERKQCVAVNFAIVASNARYLPNRHHSCALSIQLNFSRCSPGSLFTSAFSVV